jgi:CCDC81-like prokaryotic HU domain 1
MQTHLIEQLFIQLLHSKECVVLPELGSFIVRESPANYNQQTSTLKAASKTLFFNQFLKDNDGLLFSEIQKKEGISFENAAEIYNAWYSNFKQYITAHHEYFVKDLGCFKTNENNQFWFESHPKLNLNINTYGLYPVQIEKPLVASKAKEETLKIQTELADNSPIETFKTVKLNYKAWLVAASIALIVHVGYLFLEKSDVTLNEATILPKLETKNIQAVEEIVTKTVEIPKIAETITENNTVESFDNSNSATIIEEQVDEKVQVEEKIQVEEVAVTQVSINANSIQIAKYKMRQNAEAHQLDLLKLGKVVSISENNGWYILIER